MNIKMAINSHLSLNPNDKLSKQAEQEQNHIYGDHLEGYQLGEGRGIMGGMVQGIRSTNWWVQNRQGMLRIV